MAIKSELEELGFTVRACNDLDRNNAALQLDEFIREAGTCESMVFYYSGHGLQLADGGTIVNYIVPVDFTFETDEPIAELISVQGVAQQMKDATYKLIFLDCCRDTGGLERTLQPSRQMASRAVVGGMSLEGGATRSLGDGHQGVALRREPLGDRTFMAFAADPGDVAEDGKGKLSPFTGAVVRHISTRGLEAFDLAQSIAKDVRLETGGKQVPWINSNLTDPYFFNPSDSAPVWILGGLGALSGLISGLIAFDSVAQWWPLKLAYPGLVNVRQYPGYLATSLPLGLTLGIGAWRWGSRNISAGIGTCLVYLLLAVMVRFWFAGIADVGAMYDQIAGASISLKTLTGAAQGALRQMLLLIILAAGTSGAATILASHIVLKSMRDLTRLALGALIGAGAAVLFIGFVLLQTHYLDQLLGGALSDFRPARASINPWLPISWTVAFTVLWEGLLGVNAGWAYWTHVPQLEARRETLARARWSFGFGKRKDWISGMTAVPLQKLVRGPARARGSANGQ